MDQLKFANLRSVFLGSFNFIFYDISMRNLNAGWENPHQVSTERYQKEDAHLLEEVIASTGIQRQFTMEEVDQRIKDGHIFYIAKKDRRIIGYCWYLLRKVEIPEFYATLYLKPDEVCPANSYIVPDFRGKGIRNCMRAYELDEIKKIGYKRSIGYVYESNLSAMRMHQKYGSFQIGVVKLINVLTFTYRYTNLRSNKIIFHGGPFVVWKRLYHNITKRRFR